MMLIFRNPGYFKYSAGIALAFAMFSSLVAGTPDPSQNKTSGVTTTTRERISINQGWRFFRYDSASLADDLIYDLRPQVATFADFQPADTKPTEQLAVETTGKPLKAWILPTGNAFIKDPGKRFTRPDGNPGSDFPFVQDGFDDSAWELTDLPHDWAIKGSFMEGADAIVGGGMGRLPVHGVAWYRRKLDIPASDKGKSIFLEIDGAMSYALVWLNGHLVGGWPYGYNSWQVDLTPYIIPGGSNQLAIRLDNPLNSSRWYPGGGIYRNVWLTKTHPVHIGQWGPFISTRSISDEAATVDLKVSIDNNSGHDAEIKAITQIYSLEANGNKTGEVVAVCKPVTLSVKAGMKTEAESSVTLMHPKLWGPPPTQTPNLYLAVTKLWQNDQQIDRYETRFGIRSLEFNPDKGIAVNGEYIKIKGVNQHHDLGALGAAFNLRAAERQLQMLQEMGCNAIRMSHNPPAPELLELTDRMGFLVMDEIFDSWERKKTPLDFHLIFNDWHEQDTRAFIRRDRNHPSVIMWSFGNEVGEQYTDKDGASLAQKLNDIIGEEDLTRPATASMNFAKPHMPFPAALDVISLNYQGEGIRQSPEFEGTDRIRTPPQYPAFHASFPDKVILSSETASAFSSRGIYLFPVTPDISSPLRDGRGGDSKTHHVCSYELYAVDFGASVDKVFGSLERNPFVAGEFVWTGWDHLGEPTPYYEARSSYCGIIDLAGFRKDRFYLYQSQWRPDLPMAHILPHWNWPERKGKITPVHVFTSGEEAELFLNGKSLGRKKKGPHEYRLRWDDIIYEPGELKVVAYKNNVIWAEDVMKTTGAPTQLEATADREKISANGKDLSFITVRIADQNGLTVPRSENQVVFSIDGPGKIVATDNGDPTDMTPFPSAVRKAFSGMALVIVQAEEGKTGKITVKAMSPGLKGAVVELVSR
ncbi:MAG: beta-galactosidase GalB [Bacteroidales bacterium]